MRIEGENKLHYYTSMVFPSSYANGIQILQMKKAFEDLLGFQRVAFIVSSNQGVLSRTHEHRLARFSQYHLETFLQFFWFLFYAMKHVRRGDSIYCKDSRLSSVANIWKPFFSLCKKRYHVITECHLYRGSLPEKIAFSQSDIVATNTEHLQKMLMRAFSKRVPGNTVVAHDAVNISQFNIGTERREAREQCKLPTDDILVGYVGMFRTMGMSKGLDTAIEALEHTDARFKLVLIGGNERDIAHYEKYAQERSVQNRVIFTGKQPHERIPLYLKALDICIAPFPDNQHYRYFMSPLKLFEYMASKRPIIVSDLDSIREVVSEKEAVLVPPENPLLLAKAIQETQDSPDQGRGLAEAAFTLVKERYTWDERAKHILR